MRKNIHYIVPCASKQIAIPNDLLFRNMPKLNVEDLFLKWRYTLKDTKADEVKAIDVYGGAYWKIITQIYQGMDRIFDNIWVMGAGYGIVNVEEKIKPYSAVFKNNHFDNIGFKFDSKSPYLDWWNLYNKNEISISKLYNKDDIFFIIGSFEYFKAIGYDVSKIIKKPNVYVISPDTKLKHITPYLIPSSLWLQQKLGGSKFTITPLVMKYIAKILPKFNYDKDEIITHMKDLISQCDIGKRKPVGKKLNDCELKILIGEIGWDKPKSFIHQAIGRKGYACGIIRLNRTLYNKTHPQK